MCHIVRETHTRFCFQLILESLLSPRSHPSSLQHRTAQPWRRPVENYTMWWGSHFLSATKSEALKKPFLCSLFLFFFSIKVLCLWISMSFQVTKKIRLCGLQTQTMQILQLSTAVSDTSRQWVTHPMVFPQAQGCQRLNLLELIHLFSGSRSPALCCWNQIWYPRLNGLVPVLRWVTEGY
jgi:hypothetical protein